ncbi:complement C3-like [Festucalex cinctus]
MCPTPLWLLASLAFAYLSSVVAGVPLKLMSFPNLLRVGTAENIFVECQDCAGGDMKVDINVLSFPTKIKKHGLGASVTLTSANNFQGFGQITIPATDFNTDPTMKHYVYLQAQFPDKMLEKVVLLSFQSGYIFIQTDKNLYTPDSTVYYRIFGLTPGLIPIARDDPNQDDYTAAIIIEMMTPEDIILPLERVFLTSRIYDGNLRLSKTASLGLWKIVAKFQSHPQQSYYAEFEVKEYVLSSFEVKLTPLVSFFYKESQEFTVDITAAYLFGSEVDGTAFVVFGYLKDGKTRSFPESLQRVPIKSGRGMATLKRAQMTQVFPNIDELVGGDIFASASVMTLSGSEMVEAELRGIRIVTSPYTIQLEKTPKYFKPGMIFDVMLKVVNPDETPAQYVPVVVNPGGVEVMTSHNGLAKVSVNTLPADKRLNITARTNDPKITREKQAVAEMEALPYNTESNNYIHIGVDTVDLYLGDSLRIGLFLNKPVTRYADITYLVISRGQLVKYGRHRTSGQVMISLIIPITKDMLPSFRIVAYYHPDNSRVVSDSVWVDVKDHCMGTLKLEPTRPAFAYEPHKMFPLKVTADPEATVGLVAVDKGLLVLNNKRLTQKKVWETVAKHDPGCTPGGGKDAMGVFYDAGLVFETSAGQGTPYRLELTCPSASRRKRASTLLQIDTTLADTYQGQEKEYCLDGMAETRRSYSCETRIEYNMNGTECVERTRMKRNTLRIPQSEENDHLYFDNMEIVSRTNFPESWLWIDTTLPVCPPHIPNCDTTSHLSHVPMRDSITTWQFMGISLSKTHGVCISEPLEVRVRKDFFIDLELPYSAVRGEQIEIKAILHNYTPDEITVRVVLFETPHVCSSAFKRTKFNQEVEVGPQTMLAVPYIIIPMDEGTLDIEVKAAVRDSYLSDGIMKQLKVVPDGVLTKSSQIIDINPAKMGINGKQEVIINSQIPKKDVVPGTQSFIQIFVTGQKQFSGVVEDAIAGTSVVSLIRQPLGTGEENISHMTLTVIATIYLDKTNQWEMVGFQKRNEALQHIKTGYRNLFAFRNKDGSFSNWANRHSSSSLTAYVAKVFTMSNQLVAAPRDVICDAVRFIITAQRSNGMFREIGRMFYTEMMGGVQGGDSDALMTAFHVIPMQESRALCAATVNQLEDSETKALAYLESRLPGLTNPYAVAMTSYALANKNKLNKELLYNFSSPELTHWSVPQGQIYTLEATAYALLALVKTGAFEDARPVVAWFKNQGFMGGPYALTQATILVYQALSEYWANAKEPDYDLNVDIEEPSRSTPHKFYFNRQNPHTKTFFINSINQDVRLSAEGSGEATFTMVSWYYALRSGNKSDCQNFNLSVQLIPEENGDEKIYKLKIGVMYLSQERDASMSILDIGLLTGFRADQRDLELLARGHAPISNYEMNTVLSEKGSLIIYLDKVSHKHPEEISFRIIQTMKVGILQPAAVSVYENHDQTRCVKFYHPKRRAGQLLKRCINNGCTCAEGNCCFQKTGHISNDLRMAKACEITQASKIDFVYRIQLEEFKADPSVLIYTARVNQVIKEGNKDMGAQGKLRTFVSSPHCRDALQLDIGKSYLIMGTLKNINRDDQTQTFQYDLGEETWIEYWPTFEECQTPQHRPTCVGMQILIRTYEYFGCEQ